MPLLALIAVFIIVPLLELYVILQIADAIGGFTGVAVTIGLLVADSVIGAMLLRSQGRSAWRQFNATLRAGRIPHREVIDGVLIIFGGAFLITPGFLTDIVGFLLFIPPSRGLIRRLVVRRLGGRVVVAGVERRVRTVGAEEDWVEGSAHEVHSESRQLR